jgi:hypothetical protein
MEFSSLIFPAPFPSMELDFFQNHYDDQIKNQLTFAPAYRKTDRSRVHYHIPCIYLDAYDPLYLRELEIIGKQPPKEKRILLYFHGNAEDVGHNMMLLY